MKTKVISIKKKKREKLISTVRGIVGIRTIEKENNPVSTQKGKKFPEHMGTIKRQIFPEYKTNYSYIVSLMHF